MTANRRSIEAEHQTLRIVGELADRGALLPAGRFDRPVSTIYFVQYLLDEFDYLQAVQGTVTDEDMERELARTAKLTPKRWEDTGGRFQDFMLLYCVKGDPDHHRAFTLWIGRSLVDKSINEKKPLAALLLKRLTERLRRAFPDVTFGFWLNVEGKPYDPMALHAHGLITCSDSSYFEDPKLRKRLRAEIIVASGRDHPMYEARILDMRKQNVNQGWITYCMKQRFHRFGDRTARFRRPPLEIGERTEATSHFLTQKGREFYGRLRLLVQAIQSGEIDAWSDEDWARIQPSATPDFPEGVVPIRHGDCCHTEPAGCAVLSEARDPVDAMRSSPATLH